MPNPDAARTESFSRQSLDRVLNHPDCALSERQKNLFEFICIEEIEGRGDKLKAYTIATGPLGRTTEFDPQTDSIVRVEIGRLRRSLELFFALSGKDLPFEIHIPKGTYRPVFSHTEPIFEVPIENLSAMAHHQTSELSSGQNQGWWKPMLVPVLASAVWLVGLAGAVLLHNDNITHTGTLRRAETPATTNPPEIVTRSKRQLIVVPVRVNLEGQRDVVISNLLHERLSQRVSGSLSNIEVLNEDRGDNNQDIDLVLRTTIIIRGTEITVNYIIIDADLSEQVVSGRFWVSLKSSERQSLNDLIINELVERISLVLNS